MALIDCPECTNKISDKSSACIHCGYPLSEKSGLSKEEMERFLFLSHEMSMDSETPIIDDESYLCCPRCYSSNLTPMKKGFSFGKAALGTFTFGLYGIVAGSIGSENVKMFCGQCGKTFKSGDAISLTKYEQGYFKKKM